MKVIAVFLVAGTLFLSTFSGMYQHMKGSCCAGMTHQGACEHSAKDCCNKGICSMMFSCGSCGFLVGQQLSVCPNISRINDIPVSIYLMGNSLYHSDSGWHPPQV